MTTSVKIRRSKDDKSPIVVSYDFGSDVADASARFDGPLAIEKVVHGLFVIAAKQQLRDFVLNLVTPKANKPRGKAPKVKKGSASPAHIPEVFHAPTPAEIQAKVDAWKPSIQRREKAVVARFAGMIGKLTAKEREALFAKLNGDAEPADEEDTASASELEDDRV